MASASAKASDAAAAAAVAAAASVAAAANAAVPSSAEVLKQIWDELEHEVPFGPHPIPRSTVFAASPLSFAFVNLRPVVPGHVLVSSKRIAPRFADLTSEEVSDLWLLVQKVGKVVERQQARKEEGGEASSPPSSPSPPSPSSSALTFALQDGPAAGQSVPHVHIHVIPRGGPGDRFAGEEKNDELYPELQRAGAALSAELLLAETRRQQRGREGASAPAPDPLRKERGDRSLQDMEAEAAALRDLFYS